MYAIDLPTCNMNDIIQRSYVCHPTMFTEALQDAATTHREAARIMRYASKARQTAIDMAVDLDAVVQSVNYQDLSTENLTFSQRIMAFGVACRLQCIPHSSALDIAARN